MTGGNTALYRLLNNNNINHNNDNNILPLRANNQLDAHFNVFISLLYMFRAIQCSSSGEPIASIHHLVYITPCRWPSVMWVREELSDLHTRMPPTRIDTRVGTLIVVTIYLQLIQNRYMFRSFTVLHCSH